MSLDHLSIFNYDQSFLMTQLLPSSPYSIRIRPFPSNFLPREASLIFALVYDEIASVSIHDYAIAASFKSSSACIATARLLDGKPIFGPDFPPVSVEYAFLPSPELPTQSFSQIHFNGQDQISPNHANVSSGHASIPPQTSHRGSVLAPSHHGSISAQSSHGNILPPRLLNLQMPPHDRSRFLFGDGLYLNHSKKGQAPIDLHDYSGKSILMRESQIDAREYESLVRDPWTNLNQPHSLNPQLHREGPTNDLYLHNLPQTQPNIHLSNQQTMPPTQSSIGPSQPNLNLAQLSLASSQPLLHVASSQPHHHVSSSHPRNMAPSQPNIQMVHSLHTLAKPLLLPAGQSNGPAPPAFDWSRAATTLAQSSSNHASDQSSPPPNGPERRRTSLAFFSVLPPKDVATMKDLGDSSTDVSPIDGTTSQKDAPADFSLLARVPPPANPADQNPPCNTLYVGNLPPDATEAELRQLFAPQSGFRRLLFRTKNATTLLALQSSLNSHAHGPMCFVEFEDVAHATRALAELYGRALPRPNGGNGKGGIRLLFSKNPLGVRGPGQSRRPGQSSSTNPISSSQATATTNNQLTMAVPASTTTSSNSSVGNYGYLNYHSK